MLLRSLVVLTAALVCILFLNTLPLLLPWSFCLAWMDQKKQIVFFSLQTQRHWSSIQPSEPVQGGGWGESQRMWCTWTKTLECVLKPRGWNISRLIHLNLVRSTVCFSELTPVMTPGTSTTTHVLQCMVHDAHLPVSSQILCMRDPTALSKVCSLEVFPPFTGCSDCQVNVFELMYVRIQAQVT